MRKWIEKRKKRTGSQQGRKGGKEKDAVRATLNKQQAYKDG